MCNISLSFGDGMAALTALFTGGLLWVAWIAYKKLLVQEARKKQLDIVIQLVEKLKGTYLIWVEFKKENGLPKIESMTKQTIFSMPISLRPKNNCIMYVSSKDESFVWLTDFSHPLMPLELVNSWREFVGTLAGRPMYSLNSIHETFYCVLSNPADVTNDALTSYFEINTGTDQFFDGILNVKDSITKWFKEQGIEDVNTGVIW
jgi:hypothetical protein